MAMRSYVAVDPSELMRSWPLIARPELGGAHASKLFRDWTTNQVSHLTGSFRPTGDARNVHHASSDRLQRYQAPGVLGGWETA